MDAGRFSMLTALLACALAGCTRDEAPRVAEGARQVRPVDAPAISALPQAAPAVAATMDARPLVGQGEAGLALQLGTPLACEAVPTGRQCRYAHGTEVTYIDGMADHIVIADLRGAAFEPATIGRIGLAGAEPLHVGEEAIEWQNVGGMRSVVLERGPDGRAARFVIKAMTP